MNLGEYFDKSRGIGVMATADAEGNVNVAALSRPYMVDENTAAFIMAGHLTHHNLTSNPKACYFFREKDGYDGKRLYLTKIKEEEDSDTIEKIRKVRYPIFTAKYSKESKYVVYFSVDKVLPLVADGVLKPGVREE